MYFIYAAVHSPGVFLLIVKIIKFQRIFFSVDIKRDAIIFIDDGEEDAWTKIEDINVDNDYYIVDEDIPDDYIAEIIEGVGDIGYDSGDDIADANEVCIPYKMDIENYCPSDTSEIKISMGIQKN
ncbi:MAG: hypothetical protein ACP5KG_05085 [Myxococcota bacterium]